MGTSGGLSLRARVTALAVVGALVLLAVAILVRAAYDDVSSTGAEVSQRLNPASDLSSDLIVAYDRVDRESRAFVFSGDRGALSRYQDARRRVDRDVARLTPLVRDDPRLRGDLEAVLAASAQWLPVTVEPAVAARMRGPLSVPALATFLTRTTTGYDSVSAATVGLREDVDAARNAAFDDLATLARRLAVGLAAAGIALALLVLAAFLLVRRWVLTPLDALRGQLRDVARDGRRDQVITPSGPPELRAAGRDAEEMRRALVSSADAARAADEGLVQEGPVVAAIRAELATASASERPGLRVHGELQPAEGVLAGDWWGVVALDRDRTALLVLDVSGHGALAGLVTLRLRAVMSVALRSGFDAGTALGRAAASFADDGDGRFATALVVVVDPREGTLAWANAGHPGGWLMPGCDVDRRVVLGPTGPLVSALGGAWTTSVARLDEGDAVLAWSDGLVEARDAAAERSDDDLAAAVRAVVAEVRSDTGELDPAALVAGLLASLREHAPDWHRDDITAVAALRVP